MPFDASSSSRAQRSHFGDKSRAANFNKSDRSSRGEGRKERSFDGERKGSFGNGSFNKGRSKSFGRSSMHNERKEQERKRTVYRDGAAVGEETFKSHFVDHEHHHQDHDHEFTRNSRSKNDRFERGEGRGERSERSNRFERNCAARGDRFERNERSERGFKSRFSERSEGRSDKKDGAKKSFVPRRKEIVADRAPNKPGFTTFQLRLVHSILNSTLVEKKPLDKSYALWFSKVKIPAVEQGFVIRHINAMFRRLSFFAHVAGLKRPSDFERHVNRLILAYYYTQDWPEPEMDPDGFDRGATKKRLTEAQEHPLLNEGCPYYLEELCSRELKEAWPAERKALGEAAPRFIRVNTLKTDRDSLASKLSDEGVVTKSVKGVNTALEVTSNAALFRTGAFREGLFEQQDAGSQLIAPFLEVEPGMRVIDACAGSGGKTLHLAALMKGKGTLIALDIEGWKLDDLKTRARRAGAFNIDTRTIESTKVIKRLYEHADRVLIDAPCSGLGVLRRTTDSKWADVKPRLVELKKVQADILERYSRMAKVGGKVVYSTCSILPSENHEQVEAFLAKHGDEFILEEEQSIMPSSGFDGFYMARFKRVAKGKSLEAAAAEEDVQAELAQDQIQEQEQAVVSEVNAQNTAETAVESSESQEQNS